MKTIITQITANVVEEILKSIEKNGISDIGKTAESLLSVLKGGALELLSAVIEETDSAVLNAKKERKRKAEKRAENGGYFAGRT